MSLGTSYIQGLASGLDTASIIEQMTEIQRRPIQRMEAQRSTLTDKLTLYQSINASLSALRVSAQTLSTPSNFIPRTASVSDEDLLAVAATTTAQIGSYEVTVESLAQAHKVASGTVADSDEALGYSGDILINGTTVSVESDDTLLALRDAINDADAGVSATILNVDDDDHRLILSATTSGVENAVELVDANAAGILEGLGLLDGAVTAKNAITDGVQSDAFTNPAQAVADSLSLVTAPSGTVRIGGQDIVIDLETDTLNDIRDRINSTVTGVTATVVSEEVDDETTYRLQIVGDTGTPALEDAGNVLQTLGVLKQGFADVRQAAQDATVTIDNLTVSRSTNSMDDVITGLSMELLEASPGEAFTVAVQPNIDSVVTNIQSFVSSYNSVMGMVTAAQSYDSDTDTGGVMFGEAAILTLENGLHGSIAGMITVPGGDSALLSSLGIRSAAGGALTLNTTTLRSALEDDPNAVARLFGTSGEADTSEIAYVRSTSDTADSGAGGYQVSITQPAAQAAAASASLASGITQTETLTFNGSRPITLTAGMTLSEAAEQLNAWFTTYALPYEASVDGDQLGIAHENYGSRFSIEVSSSLDDGAGGTDLGGSTAGDVAAYTGVDVVGTINGEAATGRGQYLTGASTNATTAGLEVKVTATAAGDVGTIWLTKGAAGRLADYIERATDTDAGSLAYGIEGVENDIDALDDDIETVEERVQRFIADTWDDFIQLEVKLGQASVLQDYMTGQLEALTRNFSSND